MNNISIGTLVAGIVSLIVSVWSYMQYQATSNFISTMANVGFIFDGGQLALYFYLFVGCLILGIILIVIAIIFSRKD